ncbi:MAG: hypothetical protein U5J96_01245 [Ignavibacteriaceae bacterium]|nr:hypothetical protein [Ignavibacteriaceae bacterium]
MGLRVDFEDHWVHFRKSNTEPIIRIITEAKTKAEAERLSEKYMENFWLAKVEQIAQTILFFIKMRISKIQTKIASLLSQ